MKLVVLLFFVGVATAAPGRRRERTSSYRKYYNDAVLLCNGRTNKATPCADISPPSRVSYNYEWGPSDVQGAVAGGRLQDEGRVVGTFSWVGPDGVRYTLKYVAEEDEPQPESEEQPPGDGPSGVTLLATLAG